MMDCSDILESRHRKYIWNFILKAIYHFWLCTNLSYANTERNPTLKWEWSHIFRCVFFFFSWEFFQWWPIIWFVCYLSHKWQKMIVENELRKIIFSFEKRSETMTTECTSTYRFIIPKIDWHLRMNSKHDYISIDSCANKTVQHLTLFFHIFKQKKVDVIYYVSKIITNLDKLVAYPMQTVIHHCCQMVRYSSNFSIKLATKLR